MRRIIFWVPLVILSFLAGLWAYGLVEPKDDFVRSAMVGQPLAEFTLPAATEKFKPLSNKDFTDGQPKLINFFGSWCIPCRAEAPFLEEMHENGVQIYGIALRDRPADVQKFLDQYGNPFVNIGSDFDMKTQILFGATGVPETYVINGNGVITYQHIGDIRKEHIPILMKQLEKAKSAKK